MNFFKRLHSETNVARHLGIFRREINFWEAVALIVSGTIGAGVLGIPYAVAKVGIWIGLAYILGIGLLVMSLNLFVGEIAVRTKEPAQLVGFAKKYLGRFGTWIMMAMVYGMGFGTLTIYLIGEGQTLAALFGGSAFFWSIVFWAIASFLVSIGLRTVKVVELVMSLAILAVVLAIAAFSAPHVNLDNFANGNLAYLLFPYGVILFAFSGAAAVPEAHALLARKNALFKKAIVIAGIIIIAVYAIFTAVILGVTGLATTEIATIGLAGKVGPIAASLGNIFALFAMGTSFLLVGLAARDSLRWDFGMRGARASLLVAGVPLGLFLVGVRRFITAIDIVGGVFLSLEMLLLVIIYWRGEKLGGVPPRKQRLH